jgi:hypothetical protein
MFILGIFEGRKGRCSRGSNSSTGKPVKASLSFKSELLPSSHSQTTTSQPFEAGSGMSLRLNHTTRSYGSGQLVLGSLSTPFIDENVAGLSASAIGWIILIGVLGVFAATRLFCLLMDLSCSSTRLCVECHEIGLSWCTCNTKLDKGRYDSPKASIDSALQHRNTYSSYETRAYAKRVEYPGKAHSGL